MGHNLTLLVLIGPEQISHTTVTSHDRLHFDGGYCAEDIFKQIIEYEDEPKPTIRTSPIPPQLWINLPEEDGYEKTREDAYGDELTFAYAKELKRLKVADNAYYRYKAIKAYVDQLNDDVPIVLYWN